ncbi:hypothetical protein PAPYR_8763 [Paratrimastix pyriformis]|uniref:EGF-like domain-containing protein n=1 Tax=Paratrimastix pyriformis TaxID=342808 RepID=A0ABQ8UCF7_9EUKA|nr:hypothetical protein PAPYR_8763 [Paratrimastix pyriformis]
MQSASDLSPSIDPGTSLTQFNTTAIQGTPHTTTVTARDAYGNLVPCSNATAAGTFELAWDGAAPADLTWSCNGTAFVATFSPVDDANHTLHVSTLADGRNVTGGSNVQVTVVPASALVFTRVALTSTNPAAHWARPGDWLCLNLTANLPLVGPPSLLLAGEPVLATGAGTRWSAARQLGPTDPEGPLGFAVTSAWDRTGRVALAVRPVTNCTAQEAEQCRIVYDRTAPRLEEVVFASSNANPRIASPGDTVTLRFTASEPHPAVSIAGRPAPVRSLTASDLRTFAAEVTLAASDPLGPVAFAVANLWDPAGNPGQPASNATQGPSLIYYACNAQGREMHLFTPVHPPTRPGSACTIDSDCGPAGGRCVTSGPLVLVCQCPPGWSGPQCQVLEGNCTSDADCQHSGRCLGAPPARNCTCELGWAGAQCQDQVDDVYYCHTDPECRLAGDKGATCAANETAVAADAGGWRAVRVWTCRCSEGVKGGGTSGQACTPTSLGWLVPVVAGPGLAIVPQPTAAFTASSSPTTTLAGGMVTSNPLTGTPKSASPLTAQTSPDGPPDYVTDTQEGDLPSRRLVEYADGDLGMVVAAAGKRQAAVSDLVREALALPKPPTAARSKAARPRLAALSPAPEGLPSAVTVDDLASPLPTLVPNLPFTDTTAVALAPFTALPPPSSTPSNRRPSDVSTLPPGIPCAYSPRLSVGSRIAAATADRNSIASATEAAIPSYDVTTRMSRSSSLPESTAVAEPHGIAALQMVASDEKPDEELEGKRYPAEPPKYDADAAADEGTAAADGEAVPVPAPVREQLLPLLWLYCSCWCPRPAFALVVLFVLLSPPSLCFDCPVRVVVPAQPLLWLSCSCCCPRPAFALIVLFVLVSPPSLCFGCPVRVGVPAQTLLWLSCSCWCPRAQQNSISILSCADPYSHQPPKKIRSVHFSRSISVSLQLQRLLAKAAADDPSVAMPPVNQVVTNKRLAEPAHSLVQQAIAVDPTLKEPGTPLAPPAPAAITPRRPLVSLTSPLSLLDVLSAPAAPPPITSIRAPLHRPPAPEPLALVPESTPPPTASSPPPVTLADPGELAAFLRRAPEAAAPLPQGSMSLPPALALAAPAAAPQPADTDDDAAGSPAPAVVDLAGGDGDDDNDDDGNPLSRTIGLRLAGGPPAPGPSSRRLEQLTSLFARPPSAMTSPRPAFAAGQLMALLDPNAPPPSLAAASAAALMLRSNDDEDENDGAPTRVAASPPSFASPGSSGPLSPRRYGDGNVIRPPVSACGYALPNPIRVCSPPLNPRTVLFSPLAA